jgi:hypothetical protein
MVIKKNTAFASTCFGTARTSEYGLLFYGVENCRRVRALMFTLRNKAKRPADFSADLSRSPVLFKQLSISF